MYPIRHKFLCNTTIKEQLRLQSRKILLRPGVIDYFNHIIINGVIEFRLILCFLFGANKFATKNCLNATGIIHCNNKERSTVWSFIDRHACNIFQQTAYIPRAKKEKNLPQLYLCELPALIFIHFSVLTVCYNHNNTSNYR